MSDGDKIAAATMAVEAARQKAELTKSAGGYDIAGEIWTYYGYFLKKLSATAPKS
jgi:hypothetical protein